MPDMNRRVDFFILLFIFLFLDQLADFVAPSLLHVRLGIAVINWDDALLDD